MKILLLGEYSSVHKNLKEGLVILGHDVTTASRRDGSRKIPTDIDLSSNYTGFLDKAIKYISPLQNLKRFKNFDVVQLMNVFNFYHPIFPNKFFFNQICKNNKKFFLLAAGDDSYFWKYGRQELRYSPFKDFLKYDLKKDNFFLEGNKSMGFNQWLVKKSNGVIPISFEYAISYKGESKTHKVVPIPININKIPFEENTIKGKVVIFHGLNSTRQGFKGTRFVKEAFDYLKNKYPNDLELIIKGDMVLSEYLKVMSKANIVIDQTNGYSCGVNSLFAMAMGKVVLGGAEPESLEALGVEKTPVINILPDAQTIVSAVERLLEDNNKITEIGRQSRKFVEEVHDHVKVAQRYIDVWTKGHKFK